MQARGEKAHGERKGAISRGLREVWEEWGKSVCGGGVKRKRGVLRAMGVEGKKESVPPTRHMWRLLLTMAHAVKWAKYHVIRHKERQNPFTRTLKTGPKGMHATNGPLTNLIGRSYPISGEDKHPLRSLVLFLR